MLTPTTLFRAANAGEHVKVPERIRYHVVYLSNGGELFWEQSTNDRNTAEARVWWINSHTNHRGAWIIGPP